MIIQLFHRLAHMERYFTSIHNLDQRNELNEMEKLYNNLPIIRFCETPQQ
jgi:hypothetical protein